MDRVRPAPRVTLPPFHTWPLWLASVLLIVAAAAALWLYNGLFWRFSPERLPMPPPAQLAAHQERLDLLDNAEPFRIAVDSEYPLPSTHPSYPKGQSPLVAQLVEEGRLPPVAQRIGPEPLVLEGVDGLGSYGGTWVRAATTLTDVNTLFFRISVPSLVRRSPMGEPIVPHLAKGWSSNADFTEWTFQLRQGIRWSDGRPLTSADFVYRFEREVLFFGLLDSYTSALLARGEPASISADGPYRIVFRFPHPKSTLLEELAEIGDLASPKHFLQPYHPSDGDPALIEQEMARRRSASPRSLYMSLQHVLEPSLPRLWPWVPLSPQESSPYFFTRNPYFWAVDAAGNQLPYLDRIMFEEKSPDLIAQAAAAGQLSMQERHLRFEDYTLLLSNAEKNGYEVYFWRNGLGSIWRINPNLTRFAPPDDPVKAAKKRLLAEARFRQALSLAIDRQAIIDALYFGFGQPAQDSPPPASPYHSPKHFQAFVRHDPQRANALLDAVGLQRRDSEGFRCLPDGQRLTWYIECTDLTGPGPIHFVTEDWRQVGIRALVKFRSRAVASVIRASRDYDFFVFTGSADAAPILALLNGHVPLTSNSIMAPAYGLWYQSGGFFGASEASGLPVPPNHPFRHAMSLQTRVEQAASPAEREAIVRQILSISARHLWTINISSPPPQLVVVQDSLRNVPRRAIASGRIPATTYPETYYFENDEAQPGAHEQILADLAEPTALQKSGDATPGRGLTLPRLAGWLALALILLGAARLLLRHPYARRRALQIAPTLAAISLIVFATISLPPGSFLHFKLLEAEMTGDPSSLAQARELQNLFPYDQSFLSQYADWMGLKWFLTFEPQDAGLLQGDLGRSMETLEPVNDIVGQRLLLTFCISLGTILFTWAVALPVGIYSAVRQYTLADYAFTIVGFLGMCIPNFLLAILLMYVSSTYFGFSVTGLLSPEYAAMPGWNAAKILDLLKHIWIPVVVIGTSGTAGMIRVMRGNLLDELRKPYVTTARAKGVRPLKLILKYPVRLALNPFVSGFGDLFPALISGGAIVAIVMSLPTIGPLQLQALMSEDTYLAGSVLMLLSILGVIGVFISDLLLLWLDPRIRYDGGARK